MGCVNCWILLLCVALTTVGSQGSTMLQPPFFELNLDLPPSQRWGAAVDIVLSRHPWGASFGPFFDLYLPLLERSLPRGAADELAAVVRTRFKENYEEIVGIVSAFRRHGNTSISVAQLAQTFFLYELTQIPMHLNGGSSWGSRRGVTTGCTGILAAPLAPSQHSSIVHGRNMDERPAAGRNFTLAINVTCGGAVLFQAVDWTWVSTGFATTSRRGCITLEVNWRSEGPESYGDIYSAILDSKTMPVQQHQRLLQKSCTDFDSAVDFFASTSFAAPFYTVMSGMGRRGAVVSISSNRSRTNVEQFLLNGTRQQSWFAVQTNYDRQRPDPQWDPRRTAAETVMEMWGNSTTKDSRLAVWSALSTHPVLNDNTMYSVLLSVEDPIVGFIRN